MFRLCSSVVAFALGVIATTQTTEIPQHYEDVSKTIGKQGTLNADGSFRINIPRTDVHFINSNGMQIPADLGLATYIAFTGGASKVFAVGDVAMLSVEIDFVINRLRDGGIEIVSLHNHMTGESPSLYFLHFQATGNPIEIAKTFRTAIDVLGAALEVRVFETGAKKTLDGGALAAIMGVKAQEFPSGVLRFAQPRKDISVGVGDFSFLPGMGLGSWAAFNACDCGWTMAMGDTCCTRKVLQNVIDVLRLRGIHITAIHGHVLGASQEVMFLHFEGEGEATDLAKTIRSCWDALGK